MYRYEVDENTRTDIENIIGKPYFYEDNSKYYVDDFKKDVSIQYYDQTSDQFLTKNLDELCQELYSLNFEDKSTKHSHNLEKEVDDDGRQIVKSATTYKGWRYFAHTIEVESATLDSAYSSDYTGADRTDYTLKFYDSENTELTAGTQAELDSDCVKTVITLAPAYDYDIIGGKIHQHTTPLENIRLHVIAGATDLSHLPGTIKEFVGGLNMKFMGVNENIETDGRAGARMNLATEGIPVATNKLQYIITHPAGERHELMIVVEYFRQ